jgi:hypothetical protein
VGFSGVARHLAATVKANNHPRKPPPELPKSTARARGPNESTRSGRSLQSQSKPVEFSKSLPKQGFNSSLAQRDSATQRFISDRSVGPGEPRFRQQTDLERAQRREFVNGSTSTINKGINGRVDLRREKDMEMRDLVSGSAPNRNKIINVDRRLQPPPISDLKRGKDLEMRDLVSGSGLNRNTTIHIDRRLQSPPIAERKSSQSLDRRPPLDKERFFQKPPPRVPSSVKEREAARLTDRRPTLVKEREAIMARSSDRGASSAQGLKKGAQLSATYRTADFREKPSRQELVSQVRRHSEFISLSSI